jgi:hypothetical protein
VFSTRPVQRHYKVEKGSGTHANLGRRKCGIGCHCKCCGRKQSELLQRSPWKATFWYPVWHLYSKFRRVKGPAQGEHPTRATHSARGWFPRSTEEEEAHHRRNRRDFKERGSTDQNVVRLKHRPQESRHT